MPVLAAAEGASSGLCRSARQPRDGGRGGEERGQGFVDEILTCFWRHLLEQAGDDDRGGLAVGVGDGKGGE